MKTVDLLIRRLTLQRRKAGRRRDCSKVTGNCEREAEEAVKTVWASWCSGATPASLLVSPEPLGKMKSWLVEDDVSISLADHTTGN